MHANAKPNRKGAGGHTVRRCFAPRSFDLLHFAARCVTVRGVKVRGIASVCILRLMLPCVTLPYADLLCDVLLCTELP